MVPAPGVLQRFEVARNAGAGWWWGRSSIRAVHTVDLLLWMLGDAVEVQASTANVLLHQIEAEDTALALLKFKSGASAVLQATTAAFPGYPRRLEVSGTEGNCHP